MKRGPVLFLKGVILLIGSAALVLMIRLPLTEGRAANLDLLQVYADPFIMYGYVASLPFFVALYQAFTLLGYIGGIKAFSRNSVNALKTIKYCAILESAFIVMAALYIRMFHAQDDDPAGFIALCIATTFLSIVIATATAVFEKLLQNDVEMKSGNDPMV